MRRRPARCFDATLAAALLTVGLTSCGSDRHEGAAPPPIAAAKPAESEVTPPQTVAEAPAKAAAPAESSAPEPAPPAKPAATAPAPAYTPGTSLPGAIPPAPAPDPTPKPDPKPADSLQWMRDKQAREADYKRRLEEAETGLATANASAAQWERNLLAFKNPFLPRPQLSPADAQTIQGMDGAGRVQWADGKLADARAARNTAQKTLDDLKANPPLN